MTDLIQTVTLDSLRDALQDRGFRAATATDPQGVAFIRSATAGMAFDARLGNPAGPDAAEALDFRLVAAIRIEGGALDGSIVNGWNNARRFSRLHVEHDTLLLDMDVSVAGGVAPDWLARQIDLWDRLVEAMVEHLKTGLAQANAAGPSAIRPRVDDAAA